MAYVLRVTALEIRDPLPFRVGVKSDDASRRTPHRQAD
jgi:hypothetical protein